jgi:hypothetical protein
MNAGGRTTYPPLVLGVGSAYFGGRLDLYLQGVPDVVMA